MSRAAPHVNSPAQHRCENQQTARFGDSEKEDLQFVSRCLGPLAPLSIRSCAENLHLSSRSLGQPSEKSVSSIARQARSPRQIAKLTWSCSCSRPSRPSRISSRILFRSRSTCEHSIRHGCRLVLQCLIWISPPAPRGKAVLPGENAARFHRRPPRWQPPRWQPAQKGQP